MVAAQTAQVRLTNENAGQSTGADEEVGETEEEKVDRMLEELGFTFTLKLLGGSEQSSKVIYVALFMLSFPNSDCHKTL